MHWLVTLLGIIGGGNVQTGDISFAQPCTSLDAKVSSLPLPSIGATKFNYAVSSGVSIEVIQIWGEWPYFKVGSSQTHSQLGRKGSKFEGGPYHRKNQSAEAAAINTVCKPRRLLCFGICANQPNKTFPKRTLLS